jgi:flagellar biosynthesis GTPase FlhF
VGHNPANNMSEQDTGAETIISDEELEQDLTPSGAETFEELQQKLANAEKAKKQILARARKAEEKLKEYKPAETPKAPVTEPNIDDKMWEVAEMIQQGYTRSDAEFIQKNGGSEAMKDPNSYVSVALRTLQEQRRAEQASYGTEASTAGLSEIERKYTPEQLKNMSVEDLEKILPRADAV